jgi:hypothetical protein
MVLGEEEGMRIANQFSIPAYMLIREGETFRVLSSSAFEPYLNNTKDEI